MSEPIRLDPAALSRLQDWGGEELVGRMAGLFLANTPERVKQIRDGVTEEKAELVERGAHSLKSTSANLGAMELRDLAAEMEDRAMRGESGALAGDLARLEELYEATRAAVGELLEDTTPSA